MLKQRDLLLQFLREVREVVLLHDILLLVCCHRLPLVIVELGTAGLGHDLCRVVEEDAGGHVGEQVAEPVLRRVVNPFGDPNLRRLVDGGLCLPRSARSRLDICIMIAFQWLLSNLLAS